MDRSGQSKGIYQPWCHEEFMADRRVRRMSPTAVKTYMMLLHEAYVCSTRPYLPDDEEELRLMAYCESDEEWLSVREVVLGMFESKIVDGIKVLSNKRLERDWEKLQEIREAKSEGGKKGAAKRWHRLPIADPLVSMASDSKEVKEESNESETNEEIDDEDSDMRIKKELQAVCGGFGVKAGGYQSTWEDLQTLAIVHSVGAVARDFTNYLEEYRGDDFPNGAVSKYLQVASDRLGSDRIGAVASAKDPEVVSLVRELTYASEGKIAFLDKQRVRLAEVLKEFPAAEIKAVFAAWIAEQDLLDSKNVQFLAGKFVQIVDSLCYSARRRKQEADDAKAARDVTAERLQKEAAEERRLADQKKQEETEVFDPLA